MLPCFSFERISLKTSHLSCQGNEASVLSGCLKFPNRIQKQQTPIHLSPSESVVCFFLFFFFFFWAVHFGFRAVSFGHRPSLEGCQPFMAARGRGISFELGRRGSSLFPLNADFPCWREVLPALCCGINNG